MLVWGREIKTYVYVDGFDIMVPREGLEPPTP